MSINLDDLTWGQIKQIAAANARNGYGLRDLIVLVTNSQTFNRR